MVRPALLAIACACASGCLPLPSSEFRCTTNQECAGGMCEATNFCSFVDATCSSGRRYGQHSGTYGDKCVGEIEGDAGIDTPIGSGYSIGGSVSGLAGGTMTLQNNGTDTVQIASNGPFMFPMRLADGSSYSVTVLTPPNQQSVWLSRASGSVAGGPVATIGALCYTAGTDPGIFCTTGFCPVSTQKCCHERAGPTGYCSLPANACLSTHADLNCDSAVDCADKVCCAQIASNGQLSSATCVNALSNCTPMMGGIVQVLCDPNAANPCPAGGTCTSDPVFGWWRC